MQGGSDEASKAIPLSHNYPQAAMAMLAAVAVNDLPLDLVMTDGKEYILYRFRNNRLLEYDNLSGRQVCCIVKALSLLQLLSSKRVWESMLDMPRMLS